MQEALEARPLESRTRHDYERVINAYRRVYLEAPTSGRADPSVVAAAQMTEEMGRRFNDPDILRYAIQQYEFLRREYPGSKFRFDALFRIGEIYKDDLHDKTKADATFEEFLHRYPRNQFADAARQALAEPAQPQASLKSKDAIKTANKDAKESKPSSDSDNATKTRPTRTIRQRRRRGNSGRQRQSHPSPRNPSLVHARIHAGGDRSRTGRQVRVTTNRQPRPHLLRSAQHQARSQAAPRLSTSATGC